MVCGVLLFGETPRIGIWLLGAGLGAVLLVAGTVRLAGSPALTDTGSRRPRHVPVGPTARTGRVTSGGTVPGAT